MWNNYWRGINQKNNDQVYNISWNLIHNKHMKTA